MTDDRRAPTPPLEHLTVPPTGEVLTVDDDGEFRSPEAPIVPVVHGMDASVMTACRRIFDAATARMGRAIYWHPISLGAGTDGETVPQDAIDAIRSFRLGIIGRLLMGTDSTDTTGVTIRDAIGLTTSVTRMTALTRPPSPFYASSQIDIAVFRDVMSDDGDPDTRSTADSKEANPIEMDEVESLVDNAMAYALDRDRRELTIVYTATDSSEGDRSFRGRVREYLTAEYADVILDKSTLQAIHGGEYPDDAIVISERRLTEIRHGLQADPTQYDVLLTQAQTGRAIVEIVADSNEYPVLPEVFLGDGCVVAAPQLLRPVGDRNAITTLAELLLAGCTVCEYIGWMDIATTVRDALAGAIEDDHIPPALDTREEPETTVDPAGVADAVIDRVDSMRGNSSTGGVQTTPEERHAIKRIIAGVYTTVLDDELDASAIELNQLFGDDEEADIYLPEVGINFEYWRRWSAERRLEVVLHELAHVEEGPDERDHGEEFYDRFVTLTETAARRRSAIETLFGEPIDFARVRRYIIESVHEETIEPDLERPEERQRTLRGQFGVDASSHY